MSDAGKHSYTNCFSFLKPQGLAFPVSVILKDHFTSVVPVGCAARLAWDLG